MVKVKIGNEEREWSDVKDRWICQRIEGRRADKLPDCVQVRIQEGSLDMVLTTPGCSSGLGGVRPPNQKEEAVFALWDKLNLNKPAFSCGNVQAFLEQLRRLL